MWIIGLLTNFFVLLEVFTWTEATSCASCHSAVDTKCSHSDYTSAAKDCYDVNPCAVSIISGTGHTFRGCSRDPECYENDLCETCDGDGCNAGAYPPDRLSCLTCSVDVDGDDCRELMKSREQTYGAACVLHFQDGACVTVFNGYSVTRRGCLADLDMGLKDTCEGGSAECVVCRGYNCNVLNVRPDEKCLQCDSEDRGCKNATLIASSCEKISDGKCYSKLLTDGTVKRGCLHELSSAEASACNSPSCVVCSGTECNKDVFTTRSFSCKSCHSATTPDCVRSPYTVLPKDCPDGDTVCATVLLPDTGHLFRGCSTDPECVFQGDACVKCDEYRNCNFRLYPEDRLECNVCETSANKNCATLPYYRQFQKTCLRNVTGDQCVTVFDGFRVVRRECRSGLQTGDLAKCSDSDGRECVTCRGVACNKITVRQDDNCLQCTSSEALNCVSGRRVSTICNQTSDGICFDRLDAKGILHRGCLSELTDQDKQACLDPLDESCRTCYGSGCNKNLFPSDALHCVECSSTKDLDCVQQQQQLTDSLSNPCRLQLSGDKCFTRLFADGSLDRGCVSSFEEPCQTANVTSCATCDGNSCNGNVLPPGRRSCFLCDGLYDLECGLEQTKSQKLMVCRKFKQDDGCYSLLENGKVQRGCTSDYEYDVCRGLERTQCQTCDGDGCNKVSEVGLRAGASINLLSVSALIVSVVSIFNVRL